MSPPPLLLAEFRDPDTLLAAARRAREAGLHPIDAHTPFAVEGLPEALGLPRSRLRVLMLAAGLAGAGLAYLMCWYASVHGYPLLIGGRPHHAWQVYLVLSFEGGILAAVLAGVAGFFFASGLPRLHHPIFAARDFERASQDRFFLSVADPGADEARLAALLDGLGPVSVRVVPMVVPMVVTA
ncbi:DUF3341 domain-containing protein [Roseomonas gilardii]|uniref:DUF3341 domain-containing protein n=1 Tax=Roseomonas gilardii TaxID=257708 RepID=A0A1L7AIU5_9PROT|nr:DUF3341 domain-containing protein [Roseomonas gilardii]APT58685.1 hypothetical protein RGI145_17785 [Roseomonas gilardii]MDT8332101.1 DUF3341 domain-containing protein [Roseomonas gilardii]PZR14077.1 MAG: DUF3341 domain-containing protein [Azospirillum brasilense]